jgi:hypothetical protein
LQGLKFKTVTDPELLDIIVTPSQLPTLSSSAQGRITRQARHAALLGYLGARIDPAALDGKLADHLLSARILSEFYDTQIRWETRRLEQVLADLEGPVVLLKGAAYKVLDLGLAEGRLASDVDLLLPRAQLEAVEALLLGAGWEPVTADEYDQHYYREWMHELPPLRHSERGTVVDLHHNILPPTAYFKPDAGKLLGAAIPIPSSALYTLSPVDTLLHRSAHLFVDGDLHNSLRELLDLRGLLTLYEQDENFRQTLLPRALELDLATPLYYTIYFCHRLLDWKAPAGWLDELERNTGIVRAFTCMLMEQQLRSTDPSEYTWKQRLSGWLLFMRSHWLRMPPAMLARHLIGQAWRRGGLKTGG